MKQLLHDLSTLWKQHPVFRFAVLYLLLFVLLVLFLPWLPLPYSPHELHLDKVYQPPLQLPNTAHSPHLFGTDALGRDVLAYTLHGARTAAFISFPVMLLTSLLGLLLGTCAGYFSNTGLTTTRARLLALLAGLAVLVYTGLYIPIQLIGLQVNREALFLSPLVLLCSLLLLRYPVVQFLEKAKWLRAPVAVPIDRLVLWLTEAFTSVPRLVLILVLASFMPPSVMLLSAILTLTYWTGIARLARAEILRIKQLPYFEAATSLGVPQMRLLLYHALPNLLSPVLVAFVFGLAGLLAFESTLSFLGIGVPATLVSWGKMIAGIRSNTAAWWMVAFPGAFLLLTVISLQLCSYYYLKLIRKRKN